ncbi:acetyl-CoA C-acyltransferase [Alkalibaculum sp. M08DMB]|uniref:Acetyl-CoA acetyltransferase n=1 Tax=Alkalibaculum sporogenes TaxID=2655001 RepID=A0A6A7K503_9FIRM|nr:thiolase family protein [Alkalibaculum sporogenes]MPW24460.1 acetyl-CoA C-acyltransferase [Alkalibaculum sporogenes]
MKRVVITSFARTPIGAYLGGLKEVPVEKLAKIAIEEAVKRSNIEKKEIQGVILGHVISSADVANIGRYAALDAGFNEECVGMTVNRICGSGIQAIINAALEIQTGHSDVMVAGGAESLSRVPYYLPLSSRYQGFKNGNKSILCSNEEYSRNTAPTTRYPVIDSMGITGENIVDKYSVSREDQDMFAYHSQMKAKKAQVSGRLSKEIIPVEVVHRKGSSIIKEDEHPRPNTTLEILGKLKPVFKENGTITAGNASGMNDAAAACVLMSEEKCKSLGLIPMAYIQDYAVHGVNPELMGLGPVGAIKKLLNKNNLILEDIGLLEINEAFAGQVLGCCKELGNYIDTPLYKYLNVNGGAVAFGHPLGMSGARLVGTIAYEFGSTDTRYAIASACTGGGMGIGILLKKPE